MSQEEQLKTLISKRGHIKSSLTRYSNYLDENQDKISQLQLRVPKIEETWSEFGDIQTQIELIKATAEQFQEREKFETTYFNLLDNYQKAIVPKTMAAFNNANQSSSTSTVSDSHIKLPTINLPTFSGSYDQWIPFYDTFCSLIQNNNSLTNIQKFHYLRSSLKGDATQTIDSLGISSDNYEVAWNLLKQRYENKKLIVHGHVSGLFDLPVIAKESSSALRQLCDSFLKHIRALEALNLPTNSWDALLTYLLATKFDFNTKREWESQNKTNELPTLTEMTTFLIQRCQMLEALSNGTKPDHSNSKYVSNVPTKFINPQKGHKFVAHFAADYSHGCEYCKKRHSIYKCVEFTHLTISARIQEAKRLRLCLNCLKSGHFTSECNLSSCKYCSRRHNTLLHLNDQPRLNQADINYQANFNNKPNKPTISNQARNNNQVNNQVSNQASVHQVEDQINLPGPSSVTTHCSNFSQTQVLLSTAIIHVYDSSGNIHQCRALLDSGSQTSFITTELCSRLNLQCKKINYAVSGINQAITNISHQTQVKIKSRYNAFKATLTCLVLTKITDNIPNSTIIMSNLNIPQTIKLADNCFNQSGNIDMLIGAEIFYSLLCGGQIKLAKNQPILQKTLLGWIIAGTITTSTSTKQELMPSCYLSTQELENKVEKFWQLEDTSAKSSYSEEELACEKHFSKTVKRNQEGRYIVSLPVRKDSQQLGDSEQSAIKRFYSLEKRLHREPQQKQEYTAFMEEYIQLGHMTKVSKPVNALSRIYYLPHHPVIKDSSITTKLRVVFDGSAKTTSDVSLNDNLLVGPTIQNDLFAIIIRFRTYRYVITADIEKMYRQINISPKDRDLQRIFWRANPTEPLETYTLNTVTYGTASAPFLAIRCLHQLALDEGTSYPKAAKILKNDFYVDDLLTGTSTKEEAIKRQKQLTILLSKAQFNLRKWRSNDHSVLNSVSNNANQNDILTLDKHELLKTLGLYWNSNFDTLQYVVTSKPQIKVTKRTILSIIAQIYDPLGLIGPILTSAKIIMQQLWQLKLGWDESVPLMLHTAWTQFYKKIHNLNELRIPRNANPTNVTKAELHGFCDASEMAYGACIYLKCVGPDETMTTLLCSKSRVAPLKTISLPRLELCGALLLSQLLRKVQDALTSLTIEKIYLWSDSTITLFWIKTPSSQLKTFVGNRVAEIQKLTSHVEWNHVRSKDNPADIISRGTTPDKLINNELWWNGPNWLLDEHWPNEYITCDRHDKELNSEFKSTTTALIGIMSETNFIQKFSSFQKLQRVIAYCHRFKYNTQNKKVRKTGFLTTRELTFATKSILLLVQKEEFANEINDLQRNQSVNKQSKLLTLNPFLDQDNLIRVGGRIQKSQISTDQKHPIILPANHFITKIIMQEQHIFQLHCGSQALLAAIRLRYWPLAGISNARKITRNCLTCQRYRATSQQHIMGNLPTARVTMGDRPFSTSGVDYCGPFAVRQGKGRGRIKTTKGYLAVFICFASKAIHLELVSDLTTEAFLGALRRFTSRRGICSDLYSDNGTNFVGANRELQQIFTFIRENEQTIALELSKQNITWHFNPPRSPHFGGLWESAVKSFKHHFNRVVKDSLLTFEEFNTLATQIEACLNSRPLTPLSSDPNDLTVLSPSHFLIGDSLIAPPDINYNNMRENMLSRWQHIQKMRQHFWQRWSREYLHHLQQRNKWTRNNDSKLKVGSLVILMEDNIPPQKWHIGRIVELHPGDDEVVRVVTVKTASGVYKRSVRKVCILTIIDN